MKYPREFNFILKPYDFQLEAFIFCIDRPNTGILYDMGLGKTKIAIDVARYRIQNDNVKRILVVCPTSVMLNWKREIERNSNHSSIVAHHSMRDERIARLRRRDFTFYIINYEALHRYLEELLELKFEMLIFDESSLFLRRGDTQRTRASIALADQGQFKLILTATLIGNNPLSVWSQFRVLDGGKSFGNIFWIFRNYFFRRVGIGNWVKYKIKNDRVPVFQKRIFDICIRKTKEECLDLPKQIFSIRDINMDEDFEKIYREVEKHVLAEVETMDGTSILEVNNILTKLLRLQQITGGFVKDINGNEVSLKLQPKLDMLLEELFTIISSDESAIIWCRFLKSMDIITNALGTSKIKYITMSGRDKDKYSKWKSFQKSKKCNIFVGQVASGSVGIELFKEDSLDTKSQHMIFYENVFQLDIRTQATGRIHRIGQQSTCRYVDLIINDTIDEKIYLTLKENQEVADLIMREGARGFLKSKRRE